uniref:Uncharacterized protein n=1 Tax=Romanomermis culicivorax TaxID=13658 RepID=A0A915KIY6_ROMCU
MMNVSSKFEASLVQIFVAKPIDSSNGDKSRILQKWEDLEHSPEPPAKVPPPKWGAPVGSVTPCFGSESLLKSASSFSINGCSSESIKQPAIFFCKQ